MKTNDTQKNKRVYVNIKIKVELIYINSFFVFWILMTTAILIDNFIFSIISDLLSLQTLLLRLLTLLLEKSIYVNMHKNRSSI